MVMSRLGQALLQLENKLSAVKQEQQQAAVAVAEWQNRWHGKRDRIAQRLELIGSQLDQLAEQSGTDTPRLTLVGELADTESARLMSKAR